MQAYLCFDWILTNGILVFSNRVIKAFLCRVNRWRVPTWTHLPSEDTPQLACTVQYTMLCLVLWLILTKHQECELCSAFPLCDGGSCPSVHCILPQHNCCVCPCKVLLAELCTSETKFHLKPHTLAMLKRRFKVKCCQVLWYLLVLISHLYTHNFCLSRIMH